jgi:hypothetical protein
MADTTTGKTPRWHGTLPTTCDLCHKPLLVEGFLEFVDGRTRQGPWALMCTECWRTHGVGLGCGRGQMYDDGIKIGG